jgi:hypothetical protein
MTIPPDELTAARAELEQVEQELKTLPRDHFDVEILRANLFQLRGRIANITIAALPDKIDVDKNKPDSNRPEKLFSNISLILDLTLEPDAAEEAIGSLSELYNVRLQKNKGHAMRWLVAQSIWILYGRGLDLYGRLVKARAGR